MGVQEKNKMDLNLNSTSKDPGDTKMEETNKAERRDAVRGLVTMGFIFCLHFTGYGGLSSLQSSLNRQEGMGVITQSLTYAGVMFSSFYLPTACVKRLGHRKTIAITIIGYMTWMAANGYAVWATMVPTSLIVGLSAGSLWYSANSYNSIMALRYAKASNKVNESNDTVIQFHAIFRMCSSISSIVSSVINFFVLKQPTDNSTIVTLNDLSQCGANDCPWHNKNNTNLKRPDSTVVWSLVGIYLAISASAVIVTLTLLKDFDEKSLFKGSKLDKETPKVLLKKCAKQLIRPYQLMWLPMMAQMGLLNSLAWSEWNSSYVACALGIYMVGLTGLLSPILRIPTEALVAFLIKKVGRITLMVLGQLLLLGTVVFMLLWLPDPDYLWVFFITITIQRTGMVFMDAPGMGVTEGCFGKDADIAFATNRLVRTGFTSIGFAMSGRLCTATKLYMALGLLVVATLLYIVLELCFKRGMWLPERGDLEKNTEEEKEGEDKTKATETDTRF